MRAVSVMREVMAAVVSMVSMVSMSAVLLLFAGAAVAASEEPAASSEAAADEIIVAVDDAPEVMAVVGGTPRRGYAKGIGYAGSDRALAAAQSLAQAHGLSQVDAWTIEPLQWRCMLYRLPPGADRDALLVRIAAEPGVRLAQPLNQFETLATQASAYNDPYVGLQHGFASMDAAGAQRYARGAGVSVALIDTGVDATHPDLAGRIDLQRDFVGPAHPPSPGGEAHGTAMAGVIAAGANNGVGIVGMAPEARLDIYRACWPMPGGTSRCDTFTLAQALAAAITDGADVINLSLGGPADPLLQRLLLRAMKQGRIVVGAELPGADGTGFPAGVPGVLAVSPSEEAATAPASALLAPGHDVLTLTPGGHYDFASGSSLAAAHATGAVALLRSLDPTLTSAALADRLRRRGGMAGAFNLCSAVRMSRPSADCSAN